jgi:hypothetical protein
MQTRNANVISFSLVIVYYILTHFSKLNLLIDINILSLHRVNNIVKKKYPPSNKNKKLEN